VLATIAAALAALGFVLLANAAPAAASGNLVSIFEDPSIEPGTDPGKTNQELQILRSLGVTTVKVSLAWSDVAPNSNSRNRPAGFNATNPAGYNWGQYDHVISQARADGIAVDLLVGGDAPQWATQPGAPPCGQVGGSPICFNNVFEPSASEYGQFVQAVSSHYSSVHFWEIWNEANWGPALSPQYQGSALLSARIYRDMLDAGWAALRRTGHGNDTITAGGFSQDGSQYVGETGTSAPLVFLRAVYCVDSSYQPLRGAAAHQLGCPGLKIRPKKLRQKYLLGYIKQFRSAHPALFALSGWGAHPYPYSKPPTQIDFPTPDGLEFAELPHLITALDRLQRAYPKPPVCHKKHHKRRCHSQPIKLMSAFNTEFGYQNGYVNPDNQAQYLNQTEYLSWQNPRIASYDQYELNDGGWFNTGLVNVFGQLKPSFYSYRLPVWLPVTSTASGRSLEVWGDARPAHLAANDTRQTQSVSIQWSSSANGPYSNVTSVPITNPGGYFDVRVTFPGSGFVRLAYTYPSGDGALTDPLDASNTIYSRGIYITVG
jgi:hypothetical protein